MLVLHDRPNPRAWCAPSFTPALGETLLWQGAPDTKRRFTKNDRRALPYVLGYGLLCAPFLYTTFLIDAPGSLWAFLWPLFHGAAAPGSAVLAQVLRGYFWTLFTHSVTLALLCAGIYGLTRHTYHKQCYARRARYYLTDRRVVLALSRSYCQPPFYVEWPLHQLYRVRVIPAWGDAGHLLIGDEMLPDYLIDTGLFHPEWEMRFFAHYGMRSAPGSRAERSSWIYKHYFRYLDDPARYMMLFRVTRAKDTAELIRAAAGRTRRGNF